MTLKPPYAARCRNLNGTYGPVLTPGSPEWMQTMSASKVAAVLGLSPFMSRFTLWHQMNGSIAKPDADDVMRRGHYLEPSVSAWLHDQHPDWKVIRTGTWSHREHVWATASPDRLALVRRQGARLVEIKTASHSDEWGVEGTDEVPAGYRAQVMWSMFVTGATLTHVAVLLPFLEFREYVIEYDPSEAEWMFGQCQHFMASLAAGDAPPLDGATSTYQTVRALHPEIDGSEVEIDLPTALWLLDRKRDLVRAEEVERQARAAVLAHMGSAKTATHNGVVIATRAAKNGGTPYLSYPRTLPSLDQTKEPA